MTTICELPTVGEPEWLGTERTRVAVGDNPNVSRWVFHVDALDEDIDFYRERLAAALVAQEFIASEAEKSRLDCAGERAYNAFAVVPHPFWDDRSAEYRYRWINAAKAVLDGEAG